MEIRNAKEEILLFFKEHNIALSKILAADITIITKDLGKADIRSQLKTGWNSKDLDSFLEKMNVKYVQESEFTDDEDYYSSVAGTIWLVSDSWIQRKVSVTSYEVQEKVYNWELVSRPKIPKSLT